MRRIRLQIPRNDAGVRPPAALNPTTGLVRRVFVAKSAPAGLFCESAFQ
jgi:hypothetical protein